MTNFHEQTQRCECMQRGILTRVEDRLRRALTQVVNQDMNLCVPFSSICNECTTSLRALMKSARLV